MKSEPNKQRLNQTLKPNTSQYISMSERIIRLGGESKGNIPNYLVIRAKYASTSTGSILEKSLEYSIVFQVFVRKMQE